MLVPSGGQLLKELTFSKRSCWGTLPKTNIASENGWLEDEFPFRKAYFQVRAVSCRGGILNKIIYIYIYVYIYIYIPRCSMYGIFTYIYPQNYPNVGKNTIH